MAIKYLDDLKLDGKQVLIRADFNVPYDKSMKITDDTRIRATLPTINYCLDKGCSIILLSHLGRPKGQVVPEMSLKPVADKLSEILGKEVQFTDKEIGDEAKKVTDALKPGEIALLENIRFYPEETKNGDELGKTLASLADVYINDAFATAHRAHASNHAVTKYMDVCAAGFLLENEIEYFKKALVKPERPVGAVIGGAKVSTKLDALNNIINNVDFIAIGGGMAFTFMKAEGLEVGKSLLEEELIDIAGDILQNASEKGVEILLPLDIVIAGEFDNDSPKSVVKADSIPPDKIGLDIGPETIKLFNEKIKNSKTIIWNGPMGAFEMDNFADGTRQVGKTIAESDVLSIVGGGDSVTAVNQFGIADDMSYISTGGGAFLELLEGKKLPALEALENK